MTIRGEKREEKEEKECYLYERFYGDSQRSFTLPAAVDEARVTAEFKAGVLKITLPTTEQAQGRKIGIGG